MNVMLRNNLIDTVSEDRVCTAVGIRVIANNEVISLAKAAGYDSIFIDLEHSVFSEKDASQLCSAALSSDITPVVRVPYECGHGYIQRVLDGGAMGIVFPHINTAEEARMAVSSTKFPPKGKRSLTAALPHFHFQKIGAADLVQQLDSTCSTVFIQVETRECLENIEAIAAVDGVDVLLVGANDLSLELGVLGEWEHQTFQAALKKVAATARRNGKVFGIAGMYSRPDICKRIVRDMGARYVLGQFDIGLLAMAMNKNVEMLRDLSTGFYPYLMSS
ncbi:Pyruvate/Phosphoenolpyruvate kinase [Exophiala viscosa]|uniref:Pyruvate/Phosphoenolpyruvate kinase n=1 Tax=Exophiala viscosa TaxID=2486360 RepID=A0AAN6E8R5_9EURO|nr:Pyruvate/Phosphoenolpyruvate kinase [Exophiala viscosa]KAI1627905.1 Pyruvate/Phosphoenolpyruvate kinase [Exophiala viscosa]